MIIICDLDGTLCTQHEDYSQAQPIWEAIARLNTLEGHKIIWTARGTTTGKCWRELTEKQLAEWNVQYNELWMRKPHYDLFICDRAENAAVLLDTTAR